jgi:hypothetical protein
MKRIETYQFQNGGGGCCVESSCTKHQTSQQQGIVKTGKTSEWKVLRKTSLKLTLKFK